MYAWGSGPQNARGATSGAKVSIPWGNEAEIFITAILVGNKVFCDFRGKSFSFWHFWGKKF